MQILLLCLCLYCRRCFERGKEKCYNYWPEEGKSVTFGSITVQCFAATKSEDYIARNLEVSANEVSVWSSLL